MTIPYLGPPAHFSTGDNLPPTRIVLHGTVSNTVRGGARTIARYFGTEAAGGSAHLIVDPGEVVRDAWDHVICWHAPPNPHSLGVELCDQEGGKASRWFDADHTAMLLLAAVEVATLCAKYDIPIVKLTPADLLAGKHGICGHVDVTNAFHQSSHTDPVGFPWPRFLGMVRAAAKALAPPVQPLVKPQPKPPVLWLHGPKHPEWTKIAQRHIGVPATGRFDRSMRRIVIAYRRHHRLGRPLSVIGPKMWRLLLKARP